MRNYICDSCGAEGIAGTRGRLPKNCVDCRKRLVQPYGRPYGSKASTCADCGKAIWRSSTSSPAGQSRCLDCRRAAHPKCTGCGKTVDHDSSMCRECWRAAHPPRGCSEPGCEAKHEANGLCKRHNRVSEDPEKRRARWRVRNHMRRTLGRMGDVTPEYELMLRTKAKRCPMPDCGVRLIDEPYLPASKELDHMIPVNPRSGGTHTIGNVRIICRKCNNARPYDGSDYTGPVTLWAEAS